jgi:bifunctional UDP-N-acetylglucosamine pyrophosphorylase/glucosamine-1-phosphate N-acetyltransferase
MAAGLGTRMKSHTPKVLHPLAGRPMLGYVLDAARSVTGVEPVVVYSPATAAICDAFAGQARFALQDEPRGTGDAVRAGLAAVPDDVAEILVLSADVPRVQATTLHDLLEARRLDAAVMSLVAVDAYDPGELGRVIRTAGGSVDRIVEAVDATDEERAVTEINAGIYAFDGGWLRDRIGSLRPSPASGELYLTELVALARAEGRLVTAIEVEDDGRLTGINDRSQLAQAEWDLRAELNQAHMRAGVTMVDPSTAYIEPGVELAEDVVLEPNVVLRGRTRIGQGTVIGAGSQLVDSVVGRACRIWASVLEAAEVDDECEIGPFAHLRAGSSIGRGARLGNFAEVKNSRLGPGVQQHHVSYLGDADVGARTNVGAGTITANYDGARKYRTTIGEHVFLGVDTMLRAPVTLGDESKTGAGAVVTHDVPPGTLAVGMPARIRTPRPAREDQPAAADARERDKARDNADAAEPPPRPRATPSPAGDTPPTDRGADEPA